MEIESPPSNPGNPSEPRSAEEARISLRKDEMNQRFRLVYVLLGLVGALNVMPVTLSLVRRIPDNIVNNLSQVTLLLSGTAGSAVAFLVGYGAADKNNERLPLKETKTDEFK